MTPKQEKKAGRPTVYKSEYDELEREYKKKKKIKPVMPLLQPEKHKKIKLNKLDLTPKTGHIYTL